MSLGRELKRRGRIMIAPAIFLAITGYFGWNATQGDRGLVAYAQRQELLRQVVADQTAAKAERDGWETRVSGLRARHLNPDTLDERARADAQPRGTQRGDRQARPAGEAVLAIRAIARGSALAAVKLLLSTLGQPSGSSSPAASNAPAHAGSRRPGSTGAAGNANKPPSTADRSQNWPPPPAARRRPIRRPT